MNAPSHNAMVLALGQADQLIAARRHLEAIDLLRPLAQGPDAPDAIVVRLTYLLSGADRGEEAVELIGPRARAADADLGVLSAYGNALKVAGRIEDAVAAFQRAREAAPTNAIAEHNLAAALGDGHWFAEAEQATTRAFMKGLEAPETWIVRARALHGLGHFDDAERAFRQVLRQRPFEADAHGELAQLIWVRTADSAAALKDLDAARARAPADAGLARAKATFLEATGDRPGALAALRQTLALPGAEPMLNADTALVACWIDPEGAVAHGELALAAGPRRGEAMAALTQAYLAAGRGPEALELADRMLAHWPRDQFALALWGMALRMTGDERYHTLYDYKRLVRPFTIDTPDGWPNLTAFLSDLKTTLRELHTAVAHPIGQSLRNGTQTPQSLNRLDHPVLKGYFQSIDAPIRAYLDGLEENGRSLGRAYRKGDGFRFDKAWSIRLKPNGFHINHVHPKGWVSSATYISVPPAVENGHEGWLGFGEPGLPTRPHQDAEHFIKPYEGNLTLFPSYMWHGTVPFTEGEERMTIAFDAVPA